MRVLYKKDELAGLSNGTLLVCLSRMLHPWISIWGEVTFRTPIYIILWSLILPFLTGVHQRKSPGVPTPYFTPIQPAPSPIPLISPLASNFVNYAQERPQDVKVCPYVFIYVCVCLSNVCGPGLHRNLWSGYLQTRWVILYLDLLKTMVNLTFM